MNLTAKLAMKPIQHNRRYALWTILGISLSLAMMLALGGSGASSLALLETAIRESHAELSEKAISNLLLGLVILLGGVMTLLTIAIISNIFQVSSKERIRQFGMLKIIGATDRQMIAMAALEGVLYSVMALPFGFLLGVSGQWGIAVLMSRLLENAPYTFTFSLSFLWLLFVIVLIFIVTIVSICLSIHPIGKMSAVAAFKAIEEKHKGNGKMSRLIGQTFGFEGVLAARKFNQNRKYFRATAFTICCTIILIIFSNGLRTQISPTFGEKEAQTKEEVAQKDAVGIHMTFNTPLPIESAFSASVAKKVLKELRKFPDSEVRGYGLVEYSLLGSGIAAAEHHPEDIVSFITVDEQTYKALAKLADVSSGSTIHLNVAVEKDAKQGIKQISPFADRTGEGFLIYAFTQVDEQIVATDSPQMMSVDGQIVQLPDELLLFADYAGAIVVPKIGVANYQWFAYTEHPADFVAHANEVFSKELPLQEGETLTIVNTTEKAAATSGLLQTLSTYLFIFAVILLLLGVMNIISVTFISMTSRAKEWSILMDIGMEKRNMNRMLTIESILSSTWTLGIGLFLGLSTTWIAYQMIKHSPMSHIPFEFSFIILLKPIIACTSIVFTATFTVMQLLRSRFHKKSKKQVSLNTTFQA